MRISFDERPPWGDGARVIALCEDPVVVRPRKLIEEGAATEAWKMTMTRHVSAIALLTVGFTVVTSVPENLVAAGSWLIR